MTAVKIPTPGGEMPAHLAAPAGEGPWPGVVVVHDTLGVSRDVRNQADWLAGEGFLALAPDLQYWGRRIRCLMSFVRDWERPLSDLESTRAWLARQERCTGHDRRDRLLHGRRIGADLGEEQPAPTPLAR